MKKLQKRTNQEIDVGTNIKSDSNLKAIGKPQANRSELHC